MAASASERRSCIWNAFASALRTSLSLSLRETERE
jgi:hypothetical protein